MHFFKLVHANDTPSKKRSILKYILVSSLALVLFSCSSKPVLPQKSDIKVSRDEAGKDCKSLGTIEGRTTNVNGTPEDALEDLKSDAIFYKITELTQLIKTFYYSFKKFSIYNGKNLVAETQ